MTFPPDFRKLQPEGMVESRGLAAPVMGHGPPTSAAPITAPPHPTAGSTDGECLGTRLAMAFTQALGGLAASAGCWEDELMFV